MIPLKTCLIVGIALALPLQAFAQSSDTKYCADLSASYRKHAGTQIDQEAAKAMGECTTKPAAAIPVLEKHLKEAKIPLPSRG